jgi:tetratricopeptide (TPR) repeat protein/DNA-binding CsgD family transcriptional regulator
MRSLLIVLLVFFYSIFISAQDTHFEDSIGQCIKKSADPSEKVEHYIVLSNYFLNVDVDKSLKYAKSGYELAEKSGTKEDQIHTAILLARFYFFTSDLPNAMAYAVKSKSLAESAGLEMEMAQSLDAIGTIYYDIGNQNKSSESFYSSLKIYEKLNQKSGLGATYCRIGTLYLDQKDFDKAASYYSKSIDIAKEINSQEGIASNLNNLAKVYYQQKDYEKSLVTFEEALHINLESGNQYLIGSNYLNISEVYLSQGRYDEAIEYVYKARGIFEKLGNKLRFAKTQIMLSKIYLQTGNSTKSDSMALSSLAIGLGNGYKDVIVASAEQLSKSYLAKMDSVKAFRYYIIEKQYKDSLFLDEKQKTLTRLELQVQFEKNEYDLKMARQKRNIAIFIVSGALLFSLVIILLILKQLKMRAKQGQLEKASYEKELEFKNKELVINVMSLMKKNEMLTDLSEKLIRIEEESTTPESKATIKKVAHELQKSQDEEIWKEFSTRFKEVHGDFYSRLLKKFPLLTPNELKLCAFLRLNMSSKDIAELTGQRVSTLETARYRLRQKLGIVNSETNLVTFLSSF